MGNAGSRGFQDGVVSKKEMERMHRRSEACWDQMICFCFLEILCCSDAKAPSMKRSEIAVTAAILNYGIGS